MELGYVDNKVKSKAKCIHGAWVCKVKSKVIYISEHSLLIIHY